MDRDNVKERTQNLHQKEYDFIIVGAGISGPIIARELARAGAQVLILEAGKLFNSSTYPRHEIDANAQLYWGGGIELNKDATLGILRPKVVGGGSIVNQALLDRFDDVALDSWKDKTKISFFSQQGLAPYYQMAEKNLVMQEIPAEVRNGNAHIFKQGFEKNGHHWAPLKRAQRDCRFHEGNDCITCLSGCQINSKQSSPVTSLKEAISLGAELESQFCVDYIAPKENEVYVVGTNRFGVTCRLRARALVLASGAIGNTRLLLNSGLGEVDTQIGQSFYTHPQYMMLGFYEQEIMAHKGPLQSLKSQDATFRANHYKLENVFAPPVAISMLIPGIGQRLMTAMDRYTHMACIEVATRDQNPGVISVAKNGRPIIDKAVYGVDLETVRKGKETIRKIFNSTGAKEIIDGRFGIGLHLMGGLGLGTEPACSVVNPEFRLHKFKNIYAADSSVFPNAPGINPSLTIMALSNMAAEQILKQYQAFPRRSFARQNLDNQMVL